MKEKPYSLKDDIFLTAIIEKSIFKLKILIVTG